MAGSVEDTGASAGVAVTKSDTTVLAPTRALWVGGAGDVAAVLVNGINGASPATVTFVGVPAGSTLPIRCTKVMAATTATNIVALY